MMAESGNCVIVVRQDILVQFQAIQYETSLDVNMQMEQFFQLYHCVKSVHVKLDSADLDPDSTIVLSDVFKKFAADYNSPISVSPVIPKLEETIATLTTATQVTTPNRTKVTSASKMVSSDAVIPQTLPLEHITSQALSAQTDPTATFPTDAVSMPTFSMQSAMSPSKHTEHGMEDSFFDATGSEPSDTECDMTPMILQTSDIPADEIGQNDVADEVLLPSGCISVGNNTEEKRARRRMRNTGTGKKRGPYRSRLDRGMPIERDAILDDSEMDKDMEAKPSISSLHCRLVSNAEQLLESDVQGDSLSELKFHRASHEGTQKNENACKFCDDHFDTAEDLTTHYRIHYGPKPYLCTQCGKNFTERSSMHCHKRLHLGPDAYKFVCHLCDRKFARYSTLVRHKRTHTGEKPFPCDVCQKSFINNYILKTHVCKPTYFKEIIEISQKELKVDSKQYKFVCDLCGRKFAKRSTLVEHKCSRKILSDAQKEILKIENDMKAKFGTSSVQCSVSNNEQPKSDTQSDALLEFKGDGTNFDETKILEFQCKFCDLNFNTPGDLRTHYQSHSGLKPFVCTQCGKSFTERSSLNTHRKLHLGPQAYKHECDLCGRKFFKRNSLTRHKLTHTGEKPFPCDVCQKSFVNKYILKTHSCKPVNPKIDVMIGDRNPHPGPQAYKFVCGLCNRRFAKHTTLLDHNCPHTGKKPWTFVQSQKEVSEMDKESESKSSTSSVQFPVSNNEQQQAEDALSLCDSPSELKSDEASNDGTAIPENDCRYCDLHFDTTEDLKIHYQTHASLQPYLCTQCGKNFTERSSMLSHKRLHLGPKAYKYICDLCGRKFAKHSTLVRHKLTHTGEKPFSCNLCQKSFINKYTLKTHKLTHFKIVTSDDAVCNQSNDEDLLSGDLEQNGQPPSKLKNIPCDECDKTFTHKSSMVSHKAIHLGLMPFQCDMCGKTFRRNSTLRLHKFTHFSYKPHMCDFCGKRCPTISSLNYHKKVHSVGNPYSCNVCGKNFKQKSNYVKHIKIHTAPREQFVCLACPKSYATRTGFDNHFIRYHSSEEERKKRQIKCQYCPLVCYTRNYLESHSVVHTGRKDHVCEICGKAFSFGYSLKRHKLLHDSVRNYQCPMCEKCFLIVYDLNRHMRMHSEERPYKCEHCEKGFKTSTCLVKHRKKVHFKNLDVPSSIY